MTTKPKVTRAYRVYRVPEGCAPEYCGEYDAIADAITAAESEPEGLEEHLWQTARAAGHCGGLTAPPAEGCEDIEPLSWHGKNADYCVVLTLY